MAHQNVEGLSGIKQQIMEHERRLLAAFKINDANSLDELLHDDLLFIIPNGQTITKAMDMENIRSCNLVIGSLSSGEQLIQVIGDNAIVSMLLAMKGTYLGEPFEGKFRYIRIWKMFGNAWKVIAGSGMQL